MGYFSSQDLEEEPFVGGAQRVAVAKREFELRRVVFGVDGFERDLRRVAGLPNGVQESVGVDRWSGAVDVGAGRVDRSPTSVLVGLEDVGLKLHAHERAVAQLLPISDRSAQRMTR